MASEKAKKMWGYVAIAGAVIGLGLVVAAGMGYVSLDGFISKMFASSESDAPAAE